MKMCRLLLWSCNCNITIPFQDYGEEHSSINAVVNLQDRELELPGEINSNLFIQIGGELTNWFRSPNNMTTTINGLTHGM